MNLVEFPQLLQACQRDGGQTEMTLEQLLDEIAGEMAGKPFMSANTPRRLSTRPIYVG